jgi:hypothetical protein
MREYDTGTGRTIFVPILIGIIITASVVSGALFFANYNPTTGTTSTTTTTTGGSTQTTGPTSTTTIPTTPTVKTYGQLAAEYINSRRSDIEFFFHFNCSFVNQNLSSYYNSIHPGAYVDGLYMLNVNESPFIRVLFAPYYDNIKGEENITQLQWETLSGMLVDDGIANMPNAISHPSDPYENFPPEYMTVVCFVDGSAFNLFFDEASGTVYIANGTWSGFNEYGWAMTSYDYSNGQWLIEDGHLNTYLESLYDIVTENVAYPE